MEEEKARLRKIGSIIVIISMIGFISMGTFGTSDSWISEVFYIVLALLTLVGATIIYRSFQEPREPVE